MRHRHVRQAIDTVKLHPVQQHHRLTARRSTIGASHAPDIWVLQQVQCTPAAHVEQSAVPQHGVEGIRFGQLCRRCAYGTRTGA